MQENIGGTVPCAPCGVGVKKPVQDIAIVLDGIGIALYGLVLQVANVVVLVLQCQPLKPVRCDKLVPGVTFDQTTTTR